MEDTSPSAAAMQLQILRRMTGAQRLHVAFEASELVRSLARARLRAEHPTWRESEIRRELVRIAMVTGEGPPGR